MTRVKSVSKYGIAVVTAVFKDSTDIYFARQQVSERLGEARAKLGTGVEITLGPVATAMGEIYQYTLEDSGSGDSPRRLADLRTLQDWVVAPLLKSIDGVSDVSSFGGYLKEYQVTALPQRLAQYGVSLKEIYDAIESNNSNVGGGVLEIAGEQLLVRGLGMIKSPEDLGKIVVASRNGVPVLISDVARVAAGSAVRQGASFKNGEKEVVGGVVMMLRGADSMAVVRRVEAAAAEINRTGVLPPGTKIYPLYTRSTVVSESIKTILRALAEGSVIVIAVLYVFLLSLRGSFVTILALPLAFLLTFAVMRAAGLTANLMSLGGLAISTGMIIDSTIIQVENILHRLTPGLDPAARAAEVEAAVLEVRKPSIFGELIIALTFVPILALEGIEGKMFEPLALTIMIALLASLALSLTVIPALSVIALRPAASRQSPLLTLARKIYLPALDWTMRRKKTVLAGACALLAASLAAAPFLGTEFMPVMDEGSFDMDTSILPGASLGTSAGAAKMIEQKLKMFPELQTVVSKTGWTGRAIEARGVEKTGFIGILKPRREWKSGMTRDELFEKMRQAVAGIPGITSGFSQPIQCRIDELVAGSRSQLAIRLYGDELEVLAKKAGEIGSALASVKGAADVAVERQGGQSYINIGIDRARISRYGLNVEDINGVIETALGGKPAGSIHEGDRAFDITVKLPDEARDSVEALGRLIITSPAGGARIPLAMLADIRRVDGPVQIGREAGKRCVLVEASASGRDLGGFVAEARRAIAKKVFIPPGYYLQWGGQFENQQRAMRKLSLIVPAVIALIFLLLAATFNSMRQALLVLLNLPLALAGGIFSLWLAGLYLSVPAVVGFIALFGVAVLNGVVMVTCINQLRHAGYSVNDAIRTGCERRLRPVLMTALITITSLVPLLFASGPGSEVQRPLAVVVTGGLFTSTALTLLVLPALYGYFSKRIEN
ncbi:MAG: CusA/CzcA family heavy metal efflux RND transporter [Elusimicrobiaceae bacterium]|nr:CusA/CzcA family heavy metal efflux RND transporter [Elusimicrobiaceae bacterium]